MLLTQFVGREEELDTLKECWRAARDGVPQIINLIADTGVGKTRIVHAFYKWLSNQAKQSCKDGQHPYWPDDLGVYRQRSVAPQEEQFGTFDFKHDIIPWLWWGMYWTDVDGEQVTALNQFSENLSNHLLMLELEQKTKRKNLVAAVQVLVDEGFDVLSDVLPGIGQIKKLTTLFFKLKANRDEKARRSEGLGEEHKIKLKNINEELIRRLDLLYCPNQKSTFVPLILFLDDIHFATDKRNDGATLSFLDNLLNKAVSHQWPLLVITTHWKSPWQAHSGTVSLSESKPWRRIVEDLQARFCSGELAQRLQVHNIEVDNIDRDELDTVIKSTLPGLSQENRKLILNRVDNVRWLVEVLTALNDNVDHFEQYDRTQALGELGLQRLDELLKSRGYMDVIRARLESDMMTTLRPILGAVAWHTFGLDFLSVLIQPIGQALAEQKVLVTNSENLEKVIFNLVSTAIDPSAFLEGAASSDTLPSLISFSERGYLDVAQELFDKSLLPSVRQALAREVIAWLKTDGGNQPRWKTLKDVTERRTFLEIARIILNEVIPRLSKEQEIALRTSVDTYKKIVSNGLISQEAMDKEIDALRQTFLSENMDGAIEDIAAWFVCCTIELIKILDDLGEARAFALADELINANQLYSAEYQRVSTDALISLVGVLKQKKSYWPYARSIKDFFIHEYGADQNSLLGLKRFSSCLRCIADFDFTSGDIKAARLGFSKSLDIDERIIKQFGDTPEQLGNLSISLEWIANIDRVAGDLVSARQNYVDSLEIREQLLQQFGETPERLRDLSSSLERLANIDKAAGNWMAAREGHLRCFKIRDRVLKEFGETPSRLRDLSNSLEYFGDLDIDAEHFESARHNYAGSLKIRKQLVQQFGETPERLRDLSSSLERLANIDKSMRNRTAAREGYSESFEIRERILKEFGETPDRLRDLCISLEHIAELDCEDGDLAVALTRYNQSLEIRERVLQQFGETPERLNDLSNSIFSVAMLDYDSGNKAGIKHAFQRCDEIKKRLQREFGESPERLRDLTISLEFIAELDNSAGELALARHGYIQSLEIKEHLIQQFGETPERLHDLSNTLERIANIEVASGDRIAARQRLNRYLEIKEYALKQFGETPERLRDLSISVNRVVNLDLVDKYEARERQENLQSHEINGSVQRQFKESPDRLLDLSSRLKHIANLFKSVGYLSAARQSFIRSLEIDECLMKQFDESADRLYELRFLVETIAHLNQDLGDLSEARQCYMRCLEINEHLIEHYGETSQRLRDMGVSLAYIAELDRSNGDIVSAQQNINRCLEIAERLKVIKVN